MHNWLRSRSHSPKLDLSQILDSKNLILIKKSLCKNWYKSRDTNLVKINWSRSRKILLELDLSQEITIQNTDFDLDIKSLGGNLI